MGNVVLFTVPLATMLTCSLCLLTQVSVFDTGGLWSVNELLR